MNVSSGVTSALLAASLITVSSHAAIESTPKAQRPPSDAGNVPRSVGTTTEDLSGRVAAITPAELIAVADISGISIAPNRQYAVFRVVRPNPRANGVKIAWHLVALTDGGATRLIADAGQPMWSATGFMINDAPIWSSDSQWIYFKRLSGGALNVWRANLRGAVQQLTREDANVETFTLSKSGDLLLYTIGASRLEIRDAEEAERTIGVVLDQTVNPVEALEQGSPYRGRMTTLRYGTAVPRPLLSARPVRSMALSIATLERREATREETQALTSAGERPSGDRASRISDETGERAAFLVSNDVAAIDPFGRRTSTFALRLSDPSRAGRQVVCPIVDCSSFPAHVGAHPASFIGWRPASAEILFVTQQPAGETRLHAWNVTTNVVRTITSIEGTIGASSGHYSSLCPVDERHAICTVESALEPPRLVRVDLETGQTVTLEDPNASLRNRTRGSAQHLTWTDSWGREHSGILVLPAHHEKPFPLVITSYLCSGFLRGGSGATVPESVLAAYDIGALCVDATDDARVDRHPSRRIPPGQASRLQAALDGWQSAVRFLVARGVVDPERIGISGYSYTGEAVNYAISHTQQFAAAASGHLTLTDPTAYYFLLLRGTLGRGIIASYGLPDPAERSSASYYQRVSPALRSNRITTPLLVQTPESEFRYGIQYISELRRLERPAEVILFPGETHAFWQPRARLVMNERNIDWFRFWLQAYEDLDPAKAEQYRRWRRLRDQRDRAGRPPQTP